jgi:hypothetical protein
VRRRLLCALAWLSACNVDPYRLHFEADAAPTIDATPRIDAFVADAGPDAAPDATHFDACIPSPEVCDHEDNDCDGMVDEGFPPLEDPENCGDCGIECSRPNMFGTCELGVCAYSCLPGFHDLNGDIDVDGCEYACIITNGGVEACDGIDNDCDDPANPDEDFDLADDVSNCGICGRLCQAVHAGAVCTAGVCGYGACDPGFADLIPGVIGCEYACPVFPTEAESCNNTDDDCDGVIDEGNPGGGAACGGGPGVCTPGTTTCAFGTLLCLGEGTPSAEVCDDIDNDCDGTVDDGFDKDNDPRYCGGCTPCDLPFAVEGCAMGSCTIAFCQSGHVDLDGDPANGCEYACSIGGPEVCNGVDDDCDGMIDTADLGILLPSNFCNTQGPCAGTAPTCTSSACDSTITWRCVYAAPVQTDSCGQPVLQETLCDGEDNDCDNAVDDAFPLLGSGCDDGDVGICRGTGVYVCNPAGDDVECDITTPGASPVAEVCNGLDDDCDGVLDDGAPDSLVHVTDGALDFMIYRYEASRPDASGTGDGVLDHRSCSRAGVLPWRSVTWLEADSACAAAGARLCTEAEWQAACEGPLNLTYPYGNAYQPNACNGNDFDIDCSAPDEDELMSTGTAYGCPAPAASLCVSPSGAYDLSGNLKEWTGTQVTMSPPTYRIRGGAYDNIASGLTCQFDFLAAQDDYYFTNLGFRCCASVTP